MTTQARRKSRSRSASAQRRTPATQTPDAGRIDVGEVRQTLGLSRKLFSRLTGYSERAIADWEAGKDLSDASRQRMLEVRRLSEGLARVMRKRFIPQWLQAPNEGFGGLKPLEVVERGEIDRLWHMIYYLESGTPG